jgi:4-amino-4-deoxy-L-arabinose transferase-like glycosyltransferase
MKVPKIYKGTSEAPVSNLAHADRNVLTLLSGIQNYFIPLLIILTLVADLQGILRIDAVIRGWDGCDLGSIARNYLRNGFHLFYPQIDWGGNGTGYVEMHFPLIPFLTAKLYALFGLHEELAIIFPILSGIGTVLAVYIFARHLFDATVGFIAGIFVALSPWWAWQTTIFLNDPAMIFCGVLGLYYFVRWTETEARMHYFCSAFFVSLSILLKLPALYLGIPLLFLWLIKYRSSAVRLTKFWLYGVMVLLPSFLWYYHAYRLYVEYGNTFGIITGGYLKFSSLNTFLSHEFYSFYLGRTFLDVLTPLVSLLYVYGLFRKEDSMPAYVFHVWCGGVILFQLSAGAGSSQGGQYLIPILPPAAILAARSLTLLFTKLSARSELKTNAQRRLVIILWILIALFGMNYTKYLYTLKYLDILEKERKEVGSLVAQKTEPGALLIISSTHPNESKVQSEKQLDTPSQMFYYCDRKGWFITMRWLDSEFIEQCRKQGASYLLVPLEVANFEMNHPTYKYLSEHYTQLVHTNDCLLFNLKK